MAESDDRKRNVNVRRVSSDDVVVVTELVDALFKELHDGEPVPRYRLESVEAVLTDRRRCFGFLAFAEGKAIGVLLMTEGTAIYAGGAFGVLTELYVSPTSRSKGVASFLVRKAVEFARQRGWKRMDVGAPHQPKWSRSLKFYLSEGFVEVGPRLRFDL
ncbi:hypothetical protein CR51_22945 [Caballeronia megalochromosomata]|nr:hypothetical protein CR51_22945 [Caballeronia megalochromosomata]